MPLVRCSAARATDTERDLTAGSDDEGVHDA
jgi:hypothetical protein